MLHDRHNNVHFPQQVTLLYDGQGDASFAGVRWASREALLTVGAAPGLALWDRRADCSAGPVARARGGENGNAESGSGSGRVPRQRCVDVLPSAPHHVATGSAEADGGVTRWDLRQLVRFGHGIRFLAPARASHFCAHFFAFSFFA